MSKPDFVLFDVPEDLAEEIYKVVSKAKGSGKVKKGTNETTKAIERGNAKLVVIATDVDPPEIVAYLPLLCDSKKIPFIYVPSKKKLGESVGIEVGAASVAIVESGEAENDIKKIVDKIKELRAKAGA
ncbi:MAG: 50S ribosomal protein L7Ae [Caldisphaera sp.]|nr:50S ribosomal protein L7Ae [Caldisphaera sp.]PMP59465.1 MAG: 50S ribosomal protein L7ae [Caldisphaera sp.]